MSLIWFPIAALGVWRVTHLLVAEDGPWNIVARLRQGAGSRFLGKLLDCFACLSLWVSIPFTLVLERMWLERVLLFLGLSGAALLIERLLPKDCGVPPAHYVEDSPEKENQDDVLRS